MVVRISQRSLPLADKKGGGSGDRDDLSVWDEAKALARTASVPCFWMEENDPETPDPVYPRTAAQEKDAGHVFDPSRSGGHGNELELNVVSR